MSVSGTLGILHHFRLHQRGIRFRTRRTGKPVHRSV